MWGIVRHIIYLLFTALRLCLYGRGGVLAFKGNVRSIATNRLQADWTENLWLEKMKPRERSQKLQGSLETCHVTFGCQRSVRRSKGAPVHI